MSIDDRIIQEGCIGDELSSKEYEEDFDDE
jgi:hypothetical protein